SGLVERSLPGVAANLARSPTGPERLYYAAAGAGWWLAGGLVFCAVDGWPGSLSFAAPAVPACSNQPWHAAEHWSTSADATARATDVVWRCCLEPGRGRGPGASHAESNNRALAAWSESGPGSKS